jgi:hypothetical protein
MWPPFVRKMQQPTENLCRRLGGLWRGNANEVERVGTTLPHHFGRLKRQKIKKLKYVMANACGQQTSKICNNQPKTVSAVGGGFLEETPTGRNM